MDRLDALHSFVRLVEVGSFTEVARERRVSQSTVSKQLAALEEELGAQLVDRTTRTQRLTEAGAQVYAEAQEILARYDSLGTSLEQADIEPRGRVRLSVPVVFGERHLVPHVPALLTRYPALELELAFNDRYVDLVDGGFDAAIRVGVPIDSSLRTRKLGETPRYLVASPKYLQRRGVPSTPSDLNAHACLLHTGVRTKWALTRDGKTTQVRVRGRFAADHSAALVSMARHSMGIAMLAAWLVDEHVARGRLVPVLDAYTLPRAPIQALMPPGRFVHPRVRTVLDHFADAFEGSLASVE
ncbi:MAG: LysR family transcriptional regulator [Myxococcota bacterium]